MSSRFTLSIRKKASIQVQEAVDYYNESRPKQGIKFLRALKSHFKTLKVNPFFEKRYDDVRCLPIKNYPYIIHFTVNEDGKIVEIRAVLSTFKQNINLL